MSILQRFGRPGHRAKEAALVERIRVLEAALAKRNAAASSVAARPWFTIAVATTILMFGFLLGIYMRPAMQAAADWVMAQGRGTPSQADAVNAAYEKGDYATALRLLLPLAEQGDARAQSALGDIYYHGRGMPENDAEALKWFRRAAEQGDVFAQFHVAEMHAQGQSVPQDHVEAAKWYRFAADRGYARAQYNLGLAYARGEGVPLDNVRAHMWFNLAVARFGVSDSRSRNAAITNRDMVTKKMTAEQIAEAQKLAREWRSK